MIVTVVLSTVSLQTLLSAVRCWRRSCGFCLRHPPQSEQRGHGSTGQGAFTHIVHHLICYTKLPCLVFSLAALFCFLTLNHLSTHSISNNPYT